MAVVYDRGRHAGRVIGNTRYTEHFSSLVPGGDRLGDRRHTNDISPKCSVHPYFCRRLVCRSRQCTIDAAVDELLKFGIAARFESFTRDRTRLFHHDLVKLTIVHFAHIRESRSKSVVVTAAKRVDADAIDMVSDDHQTAGHHVDVKASAGIGQYEVLYTQ